MIQDFANSFINHFKSVTPESNDIGICIKNNSILISVNKGIITFPPVSLAKETGVYLFTINNVNYFSVNMDETQNFLFYNISNIRNLEPKIAVFAGITAYHICNWYNCNSYCGKCGKPMHHSDTERAMICECGNIIYPKISPAVIVAVINEDKILLTKYNRGYAHWALVAGYNEIGETIEETVHREVMEETGLKVKDLKYYKSQPWGLSSSLLFGFICEVDGNDAVFLDNDELKEAKWFKRDEIDFSDDRVSLTREMIQAFKNNKL